MRIRFLSRVFVAGGPYSGPGDVAETDEIFFKKDLAEAYVRKGWAVEESPMQAEATTKAMIAPPADTMMTREKVATKQK
jgi:hypothetical protein